MKFCPDHWERLRAAIESRGLMALVADSGEQAASNLARELTDGPTIDSFDPLMGAHNMIVSNAMNEIKTTYQQNPLMVFADETEHPEWACPICALNWCHAEHNRLCTQEGCNYPKEYDWSSAIDTCADAMVKEWRRFGAGQDDH